VTCEQTTERARPRFARWQIKSRLGKFVYSWYSAKSIDGIDVTIVAKKYYKNM